MNIQKFECPNCHAGLESDYGNEGIFFCKYCGQKIIVEEIQNAEYDLKIRKMEMEHEEKRKTMEQESQNIKFNQEMELKKMEHRHNMITTFVVVGCFVGFFILIELICFLGMMFG